MSALSTPRGAFWVATALATALPSWAAAQEEACVALEACVDACGGFEDAGCLDGCLALSDDPEATRLFGEAIGCVRESGCALDDFDCLGEACGDSFFEVDDYCGFEGDDEGRCDDLGACLDGCEGAADDLACINLCVAQAEDGEVKGAYEALIACVLESGCPEGNDACFAEVCGEEFLEVGALCGGEDPEDDFGNEPVDDCAASPGADCCLLANDGECDEPDFCDEGTDTTDCKASAEAEPEGQPLVGEADDEGSGGCAAAPGSPSGLGWLLAALGIGVTRRSSRRRSGR